MKNMKSMKIYENMNSSKGFYRGSRLPLSVVKLYDTRSQKSMKPMKSMKIYENL